MNTDLAEKLMQKLVDAKAATNNTIDINAYGNGVLDAVKELQTQGVFAPGPVPRRPSADAPGTGTRDGADIIHMISSALFTADPRYLAQLANQILEVKVQYNGDDLFEVSE